MNEVDSDQYFAKPAPVTTPVSDGMVDSDAYFSSTPTAPKLQPQDLLSKIYHPVIEGGAQGIGGAAAGIMGSPAGPVGAGAAAVAGSAAMYPPANDAANAIDLMRGIQPSNPGSLMTQLQSGLENEATARSIGKVVEAAAPLVKTGIIKTISGLFGPSEEAISRWIENPSLPSSLDPVQLAYKLPETLGKLKMMISQGNANAMNLLSASTNAEEGAIPSSQITDAIQKVADDLKASRELVGPARQAANNQLMGIVKSVGQILKPEQPNFQLLDESGKVIPWSAPDALLPEQTVKQVIDSVRDNINWTDPGLTRTNSALTKVAGMMDDWLKTGNPDYREAMKPVADAMDVLDKTTDAMHLTKNIGEGLRPSDATVSALQNVNKTTKSITQDALNRLNDLTGDDYVSAAQDAKIPPFHA